MKHALDTNEMAEILESQGFTRQTFNGFWRHPSGFTITFETPNARRGDDLWTIAFGKCLDGGRWVSGAGPQGHGVGALLAVLIAGLDPYEAKTLMPLPEGLEVLRWKA